MRIFNYRLTKYSAVCAWPAEWAIDVRHAKLLHNLLMLAPCKTYAEIGSCAGVSTTAVVEALRKGKRVKVHLCDCTFTQPLLSLVGPWLKGGAIRLHETKSTTFLKSQTSLDFAFLDGDHSLTTLKSELAHLQRLNVRHIAAHDTSALERALAHGMPEKQFSGPAFLREHLQCLPGWYCLEERRRRKWEATVRGFFFATRDLAFYRVAQGVFRYWSDVAYQNEYHCRFDPNYGASRKSKRK
jgi:hypothetical protein